MKTEQIQVFLNTFSLVFLLLVPFTSSIPMCLVKPGWKNWQSGFFRFGFLQNQTQWHKKSARKSRYILSMDFCLSHSYESISDMNCLHLLNKAPMDFCLSRSWKHFWYELFLANTDNLVFRFGRASNFILFKYFTEYFCLVWMIKSFQIDKWILGWWGLTVSLVEKNKVL